MSYKMNKIGPWPIIDPGTLRVSTISAAQCTAVGAPLKPYLLTATLGTKSEGYLNMLWTSNQSIPAYERWTVAVALLPPETDENHVIDFSATYHHSTSANTIPTPFIGYNDNASVGTGYHANNSVTNWCAIPGWDENTSFNNNASGTICTQALLRDMNGDGIDGSKIVMAGLTLFNPTSAAMGLLNISVTISARYASGSIATSYRGV